MATSETALLERSSRRNAITDVDKTAQLKWLRLRELFRKRSSAMESDSTAADPSSRSANPSSRSAGVEDLDAVKPGRRKFGRSGTDSRRTQSSFDSYVTAPSDSADRSPVTSRHRGGEAASSLVAKSANKHDTPVAFSFNRPPLLDSHLPDNTGDFEFDPFDYELETGESEDEVDTKKVTVPVTICLVIIGGYIFAGAVLFTLWEDWDYLTGSYFCFITLSTIGFGDIVPGTDMDKWASSEKLVLCALWLAFGLSLLAMCFNLMQEEVKEKCKWIGKKLGLLKDREDA